jgi:hypothetical protein
MVRPSTVSEAVLTSSNIVETAPAAYAGGTTYALGDQVSILTGTTAALYESLQDDNIGNTPESSPTFWEPIGTTYSTYSGATSYSLGDRVISTTTHKVYESLAGSNTGNALTDTTKWLDVGPTNKWAMFDTVNGTLTSHPTEIDVTLSMTGRVDAVGLVGMTNVVSVQVIVSTIADGELYNETFATVSTVGITDWYTYFFEDIVQRDALLVPGLPAYSNPTIRVILTGTGTADMSLGTLVVGKSKYLGAALRDGASVGINDFSRKDTDDFGNYTIVERAFAKRGTFRVAMASNMVDGIQRTLGELRATPTLFEASDEFSSTLIFGFYKNFSIGFEYALTSYCNIEIEGLT